MGHFCFVSINCISLILGYRGFDFGNLSGFHHFLSDFLTYPSDIQLVLSSFPRYLSNFQLDLSSFPCYLSNFQLDPSNFPRYLINSQQDLSSFPLYLSSFPRDLNITLLEQFSSTPRGYFLI